MLPGSVTPGEMQVRRLGELQHEDINMGRYQGAK